MKKPPLPPDAYMGIGRGCRSYNSRKKSIVKIRAYSLINQSSMDLRELGLVEAYKSQRVKLNKGPNHITMCMFIETTHVPHQTTIDCRHRNTILQLGRR